MRVEGSLHSLLSKAAECCDRYLSFSANEACRGSSHGHIAMRLEGVLGLRDQWTTLLDFPLNVAEQFMKSINQNLIAHDNWIDD